VCVCVCVCVCVYIYIYIYIHSKQLSHATATRLVIEGHILQWIEHLYRANGTATAYKESRSLTKIYIFTCFLLTVKIIRCTHNVVVMYCEICISPTTLQTERTCGMLLTYILQIYLFVDYNARITKFKINPK
jgi:hypothetical protein